MLPELDALSTGIAFVAVTGAGIIGLWFMPMGMTERTILTMVLPAMVAFGAIMVAIGIAHGQHRAVR